MSKLPIINICDSNRATYGNKTYDFLSSNKNYQIQKWNCLSENGDNCGIRCRTYCDVSPYVIVGDKKDGEEISADNHDDLIKKIEEYFNS